MRYIQRKGSLTLSICCVLSESSFRILNLIHLATRSPPASPLLNKFQIWTLVKPNLAFFSLFSSFC